MKVIIGGSRDFSDYELFSNVVSECLSRLAVDGKIVILSGHCRGTDQMAERFAGERSFLLEIYPADWRMGRGAGPQRNKRMVEAADAVIAFSGGGRGTESLIELAKKKGIPLLVHQLQ